MVISESLVANHQKYHAEGDDRRRRQTKATTSKHEMPLKKYFRLQEKQLHQPSRYRSK